jgi:hypothetical protein|tara:strand:- start:748 stop:2067 length:1320 start_codon:yes stop_codon:yes gene_type:complete
MAYQGLFTQGPSVDDLLEQRNKRATDLQQQLMTNAARGARDPAKAQAVSFLGSALGRALGGAVGGEDTILAKRKADIAEQEAQEADFSKNFMGSSPEELLALAKRLNEGGNYRAAVIAKKASDEGFTALKLQKKEDAAAKVIEKEAADAKAELETQALIDNDLADDLEGNVPSSVIKALRRGGKGAKEARAFAYSALKVKEDKQSALAIKIKDAYGYEVGSDENMAQMKIQMAKENKGQNIEITLNDQGQQVQKLTKSVKSELQKGVLASYDNIVKLDDIADNFDPSYFTYVGSARAATGAILDKAGVSSKIDPTGLVEFNKKRVVAISQIDMLFNQYRKEITGAAAAVQELDRLKKSYLNSERGPEATKGMLNELKRIGRQGYETKKRNLREGLAVGDTLTFHDDPKPEETAIDWNDPTTYTQEQLDSAHAAAIAENK